MPVAPEMDDAGPTRRHSGMGVFSHIESNWPNPMIVAIFLWRGWQNGGLCSLRDLEWAVTLAKPSLTAVSTETGTRWESGFVGRSWDFCSEEPGRSRAAPRI